MASGGPRLLSFSLRACSSAAAARARRLCLRLREGRGTRVRREAAIEDYAVSVAELADRRWCSCEDEAEQVECEDARGAEATDEMGC